MRVVDKGGEAGDAFATSPNTHAWRNVKWPKTRAASFNPLNPHLLLTKSQSSLPNLPPFSSHHKSAGAGGGTGGVRGNWVPGSLAYK